jgi:ABC-type spermidine/putrescine transport system permease subunit II
MRFKRTYRPDQPSWLMRFGAFGGLVFMHVPVFIIILYAFTTEDRTYRFPPPGLTLHWFEKALAAPRPSRWCSARWPRSRWHARNSARRIH